jgi:hypothetical protein
MEPTNTLARFGKSCASVEFEKMQTKQMSKFDDRLNLKPDRLSASQLETSSETKRTQGASATSGRTCK